MNRETFGLLSIINDWSTGESTLTWTGNQPASADNWAARKLTVVEDRNGSRVRIGDEPPGEGQIGQNRKFSA